MTLFVHIGLPKTRTTLFQKYVFPVLDRHGAIKYHRSNTRISNLLTDLYWGRSSEAAVRQEIDALADASSSLPNLVSREALVGVDPATWEQNADRNLRLFGPDATILVTLRSPDGYLRSIYQQKVHEGNVIPPDRFLLSEEAYAQMVGHARVMAGELFNLDRFSFADLISMYQARFANVFFIPEESLENPLIWRKIFELDESFEIDVIADAVRSSKRVNPTYSDLAMRMTFQREKILKRFGLKSFGSNDIGLYARRKQSAASPGSGIAGAIPSKRRGFRGGPLGFFKLQLKRVFRFMGRFTSWRRIMQDLVSTRRSARRYQLPDGLYLGRFRDENERIYSDLVSNPDGYLRVVRENSANLPSKVGSS